MMITYDCDINWLRLLKRRRDINVLILYIYRERERVPQVSSMNTLPEPDAAVYFVPLARSARCIKEIKHAQEYLLIHSQLRLV